MAYKLQKTSQRAIGFEPMDEWHIKALAFCVIFLFDSQYTSESYQNEHFLPYLQNNLELVGSFLSSGNSFLK